MPNERKRLNIRVVDSLKPEATKYDVIDTEGRGLILRVRPSGKKTWYVRGRLGGRDTWRKIGDYHKEHLNVKAARDRAAAIRAAFDQGEDLDAPPPAGDVNTVEDLWGRYCSKVETLRRQRKRKASSMYGDRLNYSTFLAAWADRPLAEIAPDEVEKLVTRISRGFKVDGKRHGGPVAANRALSLLSNMWRYASKDRHPANPCRDVGAEHEIGRKTFVAAEQMPNFLAAVEAEGGDFADAVKLGLLTGLRRGNLTGLKWEWVGDLVPDGGEWILRAGDLDGEHPGIEIPPDEFKGGRVHCVPLVAAAVEVLKRRREAAIKGAMWVFPSDKAHSGHLGDSRRRWAKLVAFMNCVGANKTRRDDPRPGWHCLRHTLARAVYSQGPFVDVVAEILGHSRKARAGVTADYIAASNPEAVRPFLEKAARAMLGEPEPAAEAADGPATVIKFPKVKRG